MSNQRAAQALGVVKVQEDRPQPTTITQMLDQYKPQIAAALPAHMTPERMMRICRTEISKTPKLGRAEPKSLFGAIIQCAQIGLEPGGALGHAYLLPFENRKKGIIEVQLLIGYRGMIELARRSGQVSTLYAAIVNRSDLTHPGRFHYAIGDTPKIDHVPNLFDPEHEPIGAYAVARFKDGTTQSDFMRIDEIETTRKRSRAKDDGPWVTDYVEMCKKTAVRRLFKYLPVSIEMIDAVARANDLDTAVDLGESQNTSDIIEGVAREFETKSAKEIVEPENAGDAIIAATDQQQAADEFLEATTK